MNIETLQKAKELERKIEDYESALDCFEWQSDDGRVFSTYPEIIIEFQWDGREQRKIPGVLSDAMVDFMKTYIKEGLVRARGELEAL